MEKDTNASKELKEQLSSVKNAVKKSSEKKNATPKETKEVPVDENVAKLQALADDVAEGKDVEQAIHDFVARELPKKYEPADFVKKLMDPENTDLIDLIDEYGNPIQFEQVALIPKNDKLYAILKPCEPKEVGIKDDEALVFAIEYNFDLGEDYLDLVTDEADIEIIFQLYYDLLDEKGITE